MKRTFHAALLCTLALAPAGSMGGAGVNPLHQLAAISDGAVLVAQARELTLHTRELLDLAGMSFPELAARQSGTLRGSAGVLRVVDEEGLAEAGIPLDTPLAILRFPSSPAPIVGLSGLSPETCSAIRTRVHAGPPEHAAAWARKGVCLFVVGECLDHACGPTGMKPPASLSAKTAALFDAFPVEGVRVFLPGASLERMAPREARRVLQDIDQLLVQWKRTAAGFDGDAVALMKHAVHDDGLLPLAGAPIPTTEHALVDLTMRPSEKAMRGVTHWLKGRLGRRVDGVLGPDALALLDEARPRAITLAWSGLDPELAHPEHPEDALMAFPVVVTGEAANQERAARTELSVDTRLRGQGFTPSPEGPHQRERGAVRIQREGTRVLMATGKSAWKPPAIAWAPVDAPPEATVRFRLHGKKLHGALASIPLVHGAATPELRVALGAREIIGPTLMRIDRAVAWLWAHGERTVRMRFSVVL